AKRKRADSHVIGDRAASSKSVECLANGAVAAAECHNTKSRTLALVNHGRRNEPRGSPVFLQQPVNYFLILVRDLWVSAALVLTRSASKIGAFGMNSRQSPGRDEGVVVRSETFELRECRYLLAGKHFAAIGAVRVIPLEPWHHPVIHPDIEIADQDHGSLE